MARCKHYVEAFDCCTKTSEWVDGLLCTDSCLYRNDAFPNCRYFEEKADVVEVKHGEWRISNRKEVCICSNCEKAVPFVLICTEPHKVEYGFCPHCGADMRKEGADNDL